MLIEKLTSACGLPGFEDEVRDIIKEEIESLVDSVKIDRMGNLLAEKNAKLPGPHIVLSAHMDEVGLCVKTIDKDGYLKFRSWGVDARLLPSMRVLCGKEKLLGVIGSKPIHLQKPEEGNTIYDIDSLYIDLGFSKKEETEKHINPGDFVAFASEYREFGNGKIMAKALDDRVGCAAIIEILKLNLPVRLTCIFCTQEEVGLRGSAAAAKSLTADLVINIEGTVGADLDGIDKHEHVTTQGAGPALSLVDRSSIYLKKYVEAIVKVAEDNQIPYQYRRTNMGGTDAGSYHTAGTGIPCIGIAVPCRYIHSPVSTMVKSDYQNLVKLVESFIKSDTMKGLF
jgi:endoglucanase